MVEWRYGSLALDGSGQLHTSAALLPRQEPLYPLNRRVGEFQIQSRHYEEKNFTSARNQIPITQPVA
jgi:hypothetical protein